MSDEPKIGGNRGNAGKGRPKGARNKVTTQAKEAIAQAAEELGGSDRLVAWVKEDPKNESVFWASIYTKLVPLDVTGSHNVNIVDRTELLQRARDEVRELFGERGTGAGARAGGGSLPH
jgi:hypothetical protein